MIDDEPLSQFHLLLAAPEGDAEELDELTLHLKSEIKDSNAESVDLVSGGEVPERAKAGLVTAHGELNVTLKPAALPNFLGVVRDWLSRQNQRVEIVATVGNSTFHINASITDVSTIMQALGNLNAPQSGANITNQSGGADLNADQITVGGDVVGRDKIMQAGGHIIIAKEGATVIIGDESAAKIKADEFLPPASLPSDTAFPSSAA
jgi:hypothetical protein